MGLDISPPMTWSKSQKYTGYIENERSKTRTIIKIPASKRRTYSRFRYRTYSKTKWSGHYRTQYIAIQTNTVQYGTIQTDTLIYCHSLEWRTLFDLLFFSVAGGNRWLLGFTFSFVTERTCFSPFSALLSSSSLFRDFNFLEFLGLSECAFFSDKVGIYSSVPFPRPLLCDINAADIEVNVKRCDWNLSDVINISPVELLVIGLCPKETVPIEFDFCRCVFGAFGVLLLRIGGGRDCTLCGVLWWVSRFWLRDVISLCRNVIRFWICGTGAIPNCCFV